MKNKLPTTDIEKILARRVTRASASGDCTFGWCEVGHLKGQMLVNKIEELGYSCHRVGRPKSDVGNTWRMEEGGSEKICKDCKGIIARGIAHVCTKTQRQENIVTMLLRDVSPESRQRVQARLLKQDCQDANVSSSTGSITIASGPAKKMTVTIGPQKQLKQLSIDSFLRLQKANNLSKQQTINVGTWIRAETGMMKITEKGLAQTLPDIKEELRDFFEVRIVTTSRKASGKLETETRPMVFCSDIEAFTTYMIGEREIEVEDIQANIDDGQQVLKVSLLEIDSCL